MESKKKPHKISTKEKGGGVLICHNLLHFTVQIFDSRANYNLQWQLHGFTQWELDN